MSTQPGARGRVLLWIIAGVIAANLFIVMLNKATGGSSGPSSSSYATAPDGLAAYAELLARSGHDVERLRTAPAHAVFAANETVIVLDPRVITHADVLALKRFVSTGGHLVAGGFAPTWIRGLVADPPTWSPQGVTTAKVVTTAPEAAGVRSVRSEGFGSWTQTGAAKSVLRTTDGSSLMLVASQGEGRITLLASASPLQNARLATADNAALGLALAGPAGRRIAFAESVHGFGTSRGLGAIPLRWRWFFAGLALAALTWMAGRARRLGPPQDASGPSAPARRLYVEAIGAGLARTRQPGEAVAPVQRAARARLARRAGLEPGAATDELRAAAERFGLTSGEAESLLTQAGTDADALAAGKAAAKLMRSGR